MARPTLPAPLVHGEQGWDTTINDLITVLSEPTPAPEYSDLPDPTQFLGCTAALTFGGSTFLVYSDGTLWRGGAGQAVGTLRAVSGSAQSETANVPFVLDQWAADVAGAHVTANAAGTLTIPKELAGRYRVTVAVTVSSAVAQDLTIEVRSNGVVVPHLTSLQQLSVMDAEYAVAISGVLDVSGSTVGVVLDVVVTAPMGTAIELHRGAFTADLLTLGLA